MSNTYNIYKVRSNKLDPLLEKVRTVGLVEQKTVNSIQYRMTFYFSEEIVGNDIWWWSTYRDFFCDHVTKPQNKFFFGLLLCTRIDNENEVFAVSLGKSHFYLSKFIELDFGINLAIRMADEDTILLKKSRYFSGAKRQEISSYENFTKDSYDPGESVEHLKLKASNKEMWGDKNIIFADSIQMDIDKSPTQLEEIFNYINDSLADEAVINLPKLEAVSEEEIITNLDSILFTSITEGIAHVAVEEFRVYGINICFNFHEYNYQLSFKSKRKTICRKDIGNTLEVSYLRDFIKENQNIDNVNNLKVQFKREDSGVFSKSIKEVIDFYVEYEGYNYFLKHGEWYKFNQTFMDYLKKSLESISITQMIPLDESEYIAWRDEKEQRIGQGELVDDKITYREYFFNKKLSQEHGYELMDRQLTEIERINDKKKKYKLEIADLYKDNEIISVKISKDSHELIYNIEQSKDSIELIMQRAIPFDNELKYAALWFVFENDVEKITDIHSIQFLLAIEAWQQRIKYHKLLPRIYISKHIKPKG
ncbi:TPA: TIGR04141 family sporadically distributed protein [Aeromonas dhakensis]|uniref:DUF6119 family protein n=1 Tax=Aeromonas sp. V90_14 TaxID=3044241 RepID=UPI00249F4F68|nr:DUF6119 family protein [Aeromonas sp. V90_14]MDI3431810.1 TIGR04141 family sporadically distributed protein [Aeromonas sp. V90_14]HDX8340142.1 TIGR04141 family sporadically distributed protein [Aeromonas dhakensis]